ncbi:MULTISPECIES: hypothetical protein [unclassified Chitinophaga]
MLPICEDQTDSVAICPAKIELVALPPVRGDDTGSFATCMRR